MDALTKRILKYIEENPGGTTADILDSLPPREDREAAWFRIVYLQSVYEIENRGGSGYAKEVKWHILEWEPSEFYLELATDLLSKLKDLPPRKQKSFLARHIQEFNEDHKLVQS